MKLPTWLDQASGKSCWVLPSAFLALYLILDWNVAWSGGDALLGGILPIAELHYALCLAAVCVLILVSLYLIVNRKFLLLILYISFIAFFIYYLFVAHNEMVESSKRNSRNALQAMLLSPKNENVWYVEPTLEKSLLSINSRALSELSFVGSSPLFHSYRYDVKVDGVPMFNVEVQLLRKENKFVVQKVAGMGSN